ncbi:hypothetical protein [Williamsia sp. M5A3_1d]
MTSVREILIERLHSQLALQHGELGFDWGVFPSSDTPMATWMRDGTVFFHVSDEIEKLTVRVALVSNLSVSEGILDWIHERNSKQFAGHYWLRPGADEAHWQLVCELKFPWVWIDEHLAEVILQSCPGLGGVLNGAIATEFMARFGGESWWNSQGDADFMNSQVLALMD